MSVRRTDEGTGLRGKQAGPVGSWRDELVARIERTTEELVVAADPDGLLLEARMLERIGEAHFDLFTFEDHVAFRFAFESRIVSKASADTASERRTLVRAANLDALPYDLLARGDRCSFGLAELFPKLSYPVVSSLDPTHLDALVAAQRHAPPGKRLGSGETRLYILRHVFGIAPETIGREEHLLRFLLQRHYRGVSVPADIDRQLVQLLENGTRFRTWPLAEIVPNRYEFLRFLQERWPLFLDRLTAPGAVRESSSDGGYEMKISGPIEIAFDHDEVRIYISNFFHEGLLKPVPHPKSQRLAGSWAIIGVATDPTADRMRRTQGLLEVAEQTLPGISDGHREWFDFARRWAEFRVVKDGVNGAGADPGTDARHHALRDRVDEGFSAWLDTHYGTLHNLPPVPPVMLHHVPRLLARRMHGEVEQRTALVVVDGLAWDQWIVVRQELAAQRQRFRFRESSVFAWIPTLTSVSRQACFAGCAPFYFGTRISSTAGESAAWTRFWVNEGLDTRAIRFEKGLRSDEDLSRAADAVSGRGVRAVALVVDVVDKMIHGEVLGSAGMRSHIRHWAERGTLARLLDTLLDAEFAVFLTSDHGNIETRGCGRPAEGVLADMHGKRARIYASPVLRDRVLEEFPKGVAWRQVGLPDGYHAMLATGRFSFVREGEKPVAHGGASLEEVVVPLVEIEAT